MRTPWTRFGAHGSLEYATVEELERERLLIEVLILGLGYDSSPGAIAVVACRTRRVRLWGISESNCSCAQDARKRFHPPESRFWCAWAESVSGLPVPASVTSPARPDPHGLIHPICLPSSPHPVLTCHPAVTPPKLCGNTRGQ